MLRPRSLTTFSLVLLTACQPARPAEDAYAESFPTPSIPFAPRTYVAYRAAAPIVIDGRLDDTAWSDARWTEEFVDIEGTARPAPRLSTRAKMVWDSAYLYVAADMEEPHLWATLTERGAVIYQDHDFEVFIDPDGDAHEYYELEINASGTEWDLFLVKPYRDGGPALHAWDIPGLLTAVDLDGTLNEPADVDSGWAVEIAIPWKSLREAAHVEAPPAEGDRWRMNLSRVEWQLDARDGAYLKRTDDAGNRLPEDNWVWSPQGLIAMHYPEMWGIVQFAGERREDGPVDFVPDPDDAVRWLLWQVYYAQREYHRQHGRYTADRAALGLASAPSDGPWPPRIEATDTWFEAFLPGATDALRITADGRIR